MFYVHRDLKKSYFLENALNEFRNFNMNEQGKKGKKMCSKDFFKTDKAFPFVCYIRFY